MANLEARLGRATMTVSRRSAGDKKVDTVSQAVSLFRWPAIEADRFGWKYLAETEACAILPMVGDSWRALGNHSHSIVPGGFDVTS
jgi:hypothetical protein